jgi:hypothetical protein
VSGLYAVQGTAPDGRGYQGTVDIVRHDGTYQLLWTLSPRAQYLSLGIVTGEVLAVTDVAGGRGVVAYRIGRQSNGLCLTGDWTVPAADGRVFRETLTRTGDRARTPHVRVMPAQPHLRPGRRPA